MTPHTVSKFDHDLDAAITRSLEQRPQVAMPPDFSARVRALLPPVGAPAPRRIHAGRHAAIGAAILLVGALVALAPHAPPNFSSLAFDMELIVLAQLAAIAWWLAAARNT